jgi:hypothetical protein
MAEPYPIVLRENPSYRQTSGLPISMPRGKKPAGSPFKQDLDMKKRRKTSWNRRESVYFSRSSLPFTIGAIAGRLCNCPYSEIIYSFLFPRIEMNAQGF